MAGKLKKLTLADVRNAGEMYAEGASCAEVAQFYSVTRQSMWRLLKSRGYQMRPRERFIDDNHFYRGGSRDDDKAQKAVYSAIRGGRLVAQPCEQCSANGVMKDGRSEVQAHHDDYNKPLEVRWLCQACHHEWHKVNTAIPRREVSMEAPDLVTGGFP